MLAPSLLATTLVLTRALYHPIWLVLTLALLAWLRRGVVGIRQISMAIAIPLVLVGGWIVKNEVMFDRPAMSSWTGMNLLRSVWPAADPSQLADLRVAGRISGIGEIGPFREYDVYAPFMPECVHDPDGHPVLTQATKLIPDSVRTGGIFDRGEVPNFNDECYLAVYDRAGDDALALIRAEPGVWLTARLWAVNNWFEAPADTTPDPSPLWPVMTASTSIALVTVPHPGVPRSWQDHPLWAHRTRISLGIVAATVALLIAAWRGRRFVPGAEEAGADDDPTSAVRSRRAVTYVFAVSVVAWTTLAGTVGELGEQGRFRNVIDPIVLALGGLAVVEAVRHTRTARKR